MFWPEGGHAMPVRTEGKVQSRPLYRQTFLRRHVPVQLEKLIDHVLALSSIQQHLVGKFPRAYRAKHRSTNTPAEVKAFEGWLRQHPLNLRAFFRGEDPVSPGFPDTIVYRPVPVFEFGRPSSGEWAELPALLVEMSGDRDDRGVVLRARSGAGKTVAQIKAFCDCVWKPREGEDPEQRLAGLWHVPCWLDVGRVPDGDDDLIERMVLQQAGVESQCSVETLKFWLKNDRPRLLVLCDLNAASEVKSRQSQRESLRLRLARGLEKFQLDHGACGHRCVVAYRSSRSGDEVMNQLAGTFRSIDLRPLSLDDATEYLRAQREFEARVIARVKSHENGGPGLAFQLPERDIEAELKVLADFIKRYARTSHIASAVDEAEITDESAPESLISTPLLMHFVSLLTGKELRGKVKTLTDLYRLVVEGHIRRDVDVYGKNVRCPDLAHFDRARPRILAAMTRVALAIRERGAGSTRLPHRDLVKLWTHPRLDASGMVSAQRVELLGQPGAFWTRKSSPFYWLDPVEKPEDYRDSLFEFSLLRSEGEEHGFLHDSLIDFFQGLALREYEGDELSARRVEGWAAAVVERVRSAIPRHRRCLEFLAGSLCPEEVDELLEEFLVVDPVPAEWPDLLQRLTSGASARSEPATAVHRTTVHNGSLLRRIPEQLAALIYGHIYNNSSEDSRAFAARLRSRLSAPKGGRSWLRLEVGTLEMHQSIMSNHRGPVRALAVLTDGKIASGGDNSVRLWDPATGQSQVITEHTDSVLALAVLLDGKIASASGDNSVRLWDPATGQSQIITEHTDRVNALAALPDGKIASGSHDRTVRLWDPATGLSQVITEHTGRVKALSVLPNGKIASGSGDTTVRLWDPATGQSQVIIEHTDRVNALAVLPDGKIASGSGDKTVRLWDPATGQSQVITEHTDSVLALAVLPDGKIASGSHDKTVWLANPATGLSQIITKHTDSVLALAVLPDGKIASGSHDKTVRLWDPDTGLSPIITKHTDSVLALAVLPDGKIASGSGDTTVRLGDPAGVQSQVITEHTDSVLALAVLPDGKIASGSHDRTVRLWDPATGLSQIITKHTDSVLALAVLPDGRIASGSHDRTVRLWDPATGLSRAITEHAGWVMGLAVLPDGKITSGSSDKTVQVWDPATGQSQVITEHTDWVTALAVLPDGKIASGLYDNTVRLWDPATGQSQVITEHTDSVMALAVLPDGKIASGSDDNTVRLWDPATGQSQAIIEHTGRVRALAVLPDGKIASGSFDKTVRFARLAGGKIRAVDRLAFTFTSDVLSLCIDARESRIAIGLADGRVLIFAIEPAASELAESQRRREPRSTE
jgi:WD40 repeat protein